eukprot:67937-Ditylum_brightwellii.AAC.1
MHSELMEIEIQFLNRNKEEIALGDEVLDESLDQGVDNSGEKIKNSSDEPVKSGESQHVDGEEDSNGINDGPNGNEKDLEESLPVKMKGGRNLEESYVEHDEMKDDYEFEKIVDHVLKMRH